MPDFRIYLLDEGGKISSPAQVIAGSEAEALAEATRVRGMHGCELWSGKKLIVSIAGQSSS